MNKISLRDKMIKFRWLQQKPKEYGNDGMHKKPDPILQFKEGARNPVTGMVVYGAWQTIPVEEEK